MSNQVIPLYGAEICKCECCGSASTRLTYENELFNYRADDGTIVELTARVPVWTCHSCGEQSTDGRAEDIRHAAVCEHLGRLTPAQIKELRSQMDLSQSQFAELTGIGIASVKRWERGSLIQGLAHDRYMRLLQDGRNVSALRRFPGEKNWSGKRRQFKTEIPEEVRTQAAFFVLRLPVRAA